MQKVSEYPHPVFYRCTKENQPLWFLFFSPFSLSWWASPDVTRCKAANAAADQRCCGNIPWLSEEWHIHRQEQSNAVLAKQPDILSNSNVLHHLFHCTDWAFSFAVGCQHIKLCQMSSCIKAARSADSNCEPLSETNYSDKSQHSKHNLKKNFSGWWGSHQ